MAYWRTTLTLTFDIIFLPTQNGHNIIQCVRKKQTKMIFVIPSIKLYSGNSDEIRYTVSWINLLQKLVNVFHLTWIMSLYYLLWNLKWSSRRCYHCVVKEKTPEFIPPRLWPPNSPDLNPVDNSVWEILQEKVYKTGVTSLDLSTTPLTNGCRNDDMIQFGPLRSQSLF